MPQYTNQSHSPLENASKLPVEILTHILNYVLRLPNDKPRCTNGSLSQIATALKPDISELGIRLLSLRLVCRKWAQVITTMYFYTVEVWHSIRAKNLMGNWSDSIFDLNLTSPVRQLYIRYLWNKEPECEDDCDDEDDCNPEDDCDDKDDKDERNAQDDCDDGDEEDEEDTEDEWSDEAYPPVTMSQAVGLIEILGLNLNKVFFHFNLSMGVSPAMVEAFKALKDLKELGISCLSEPISSRGIYDPQSLADLITAVPQVESLKLNYWNLKGFELGPNALCKLKKFSFAPSSSNIVALTHICKTAKDSLKVIELSFSKEPEGSDSGTESSFSEDQLDLSSIFEPIKDNLEGCFTQAFNEQISPSVLKMEFPKLRVICTWYLSNQDTTLDWLDWPMLQNVRTLVMFLESSDGYWKETLESASVNAFQKVPKFKHVVFVHPGAQVQRPQLVEAFKLRGIQCHYTRTTTHEQLMELDSKLNDPTFESTKWMHPSDSESDTWPMYPWELWSMLE